MSPNGAAGDAPTERGREVGNAEPVESRGQRGDPRPPTARSRSSTPGAEDDPVGRAHIAHGLLERGHVGDVVGVARRRVAGEAVVGPINSLVMCNTLDVKILRYIELQKASPFTKKFDVLLQGAMLLLGQLFHRLGPRSEAQRLLLELSVFDFEQASKSH